MCADVVYTPLEIISRLGFKEVGFWVKEYVLGNLEAAGNNWCSKKWNFFLEIVSITGNRNLVSQEQEVIVETLYSLPPLNKYRNRGEMSHPRTFQRMADPELLPSVFSRSRQTLNKLL